MKRRALFFTGLFILTLACRAASSPIPRPRQDVAAPLPAGGSPTRAVSSPAPIFTSTPRPTLTITPTPTLGTVWQGPDSVTLPILLYHHVAPPKDNSKYYTAPENFEAQMRLLKRWGYETISLDLLVKAIKEGADLPARPVIITFDDGQTSVYETAFPIMRRYGFTGVVYVVGSYVDAETFMTAEQIKELAAAGWEVGSHGMKHKDLTHLKPEEQKYEIQYSRKLLEEKLGVPVKSFAYPFGNPTDWAFTYVHNAGYTSAVGVGYAFHQGIWNIYLLQRRDILGTYDLDKFASFLPWQGEPFPTASETPRP